MDSSVAVSTITLLYSLQHHPSRWLLHRKEMPFWLNTNSSFPSSLKPWQSPFYSLAFWIWLLQAPRRNGIIQYVSFCVWLISRSIITSEFIRVSHSPSFSRLYNIPLCVYVTFSYPFIHWWTLSVTTTPSLLWIMLPRTWMYKYLFKSLLLVLWGV